MASLRVLLTNNSLGPRRGTELYVLDVARRLLALGHAPMAFSLYPGDVASVLTDLGIPIVEDPSRLPIPPDVIHGQHHAETVTALLAWPEVPAISVCHGAVPWEEMAPRFPRIRRYVAVDEACRERVSIDAGIPREEVALLLNFVDLARFQPRAPLPAAPLRALVFSNYAKDGNLAAIFDACARHGIAVDVRGLGVANPTSEPEQLLLLYDIVFAKGRAALEALAVGNAVIVVADGVGPLVTTGNFSELRPWNFGLRVAQQPLTADAVASQIANYDAIDAGAVCRMARQELGLESAVDRLVGFYHDAIRDQASHPTDVASEIAAAEEYLVGLEAGLTRRHPLFFWRAMDQDPYRKAKATAVRVQLARFRAGANASTRRTAMSGGPPDGLVDRA